MQRPVIAAVAAAAVVLAGLGCAGDLARATSGVIGCAPEDIAIDDVSVGWSETSWAAACGGTTFRCAGERAPWCTPVTAAQPEPTPVTVPAPVPTPATTPATTPAPAPSESSSTEVPPVHPIHPIHPIPEGSTDAPH